MKAKLLFLLLIVFSEIALAKPTIEFLSPLPNSEYAKISTSIILRFTSKPDAIYFKNDLIQIKGSKSGLHESNVKISSDGSTLIITPKVKFDNNESVDVKILPVKTSSDFSSPINFSFKTEKENLTVSSEDILKSELISADNQYNKTTQIPFIQKREGELPTDFPQITVSTSDNPSPGYIFLSNFSLTPRPAQNFLMILDNSGTPVYYKKLDTAAYDFKKQPNGNLTYFSARAQKFYEMNQRYQIIDSFVCGNGYGTDIHEFRLFSNGHAFLMSYDPQRVNMANIVTHGDSNAIVLGLVIQELDEDKNVIFQWRSWDHYSITDATHENLTSAVIDYAHGNAIELANDGNIIISSRHMDEITKINRSTGNIIWRMGGKNNQFRFRDETIAFSHQHAVRQLPNGNITLFDNSNFPSTIVPIHDMVSISRAVEYQLDETNLIATLVWQYVNDPPVFGFAMGYMERLSNGNSVISWGAGAPAITEVNAQGKKVFEMFLPADQVSYRATRDTWTPVPFTENGEAAPESYKMYQNYPNPFNPTTTIKFDLPVQSDVTISVYNVLGQTINEEVRSNLFPGTHSFFFNGANFTSGVYFYRIKTNTFADTKRMLLVK